MLTWCGKSQGSAGGCGVTFWGGRDDVQGRGSNVVVDGVVVVLWKLENFRKSTI